jgi:hypothetical protein
LFYYIYKVVEIINHAPNAAVNHINRIFSSFIPQLQRASDPVLLRTVLDGVGELVKASECMIMNVHLTAIVPSILACLQASSSQTKPFLLESALRAFGMYYNPYFVIFLFIFFIMFEGMIVKSTGRVVAPLFDFPNLLRTLLDILRHSSETLFKETLRVIGLLNYYLFVLFIYLFRYPWCNFAIVCSNNPF